MTLEDYRSEMEAVIGNVPTNQLIKPLLGSYRPRPGHEDHAAIIYELAEAELKSRIRKFFDHVKFAFIESDVDDFYKDVIEVSTVVDGLMVADKEYKITEKDKEELEKHLRDLTKKMSPSMVACMIAVGPDNIREYMHEIKEKILKEKLSMN